MPWDDSTFRVVALQAALNAAWVLLPLVPSVIIYRLFPSTPVSVSGPLSGLTIRASGAFAAYLIVFLATFPLIMEINRNIQTMYTPVWTISGTVIVQDEEGEEVRLGPRDTSLRVALEPDIVRLTGNQFSVVVPQVSRSLPALMVEYPGYGAQFVDPMNPRSGHVVHTDRSDRHIEITSPLVLRRESCRGPGC